MNPHNEKLREISLRGDSKNEILHSAPQDIPRAGIGRQAEFMKGFIKQEETSDNKRKRDETLKFQYRHDQPAVNAFRGADMEHIDFGEPFSGFNYTPNNGYMRNEHYHLNSSSSAPYASGYDSPNGSPFYNTEGPASESSDVAYSLSGDTLVANTFVPSSFAAGGPAYSGTNDEGYAGVKHERAHNATTVSATPAEDSDFVVSESEEERSRKAPSINKDGAPRQPRRPRAKLLKWNDDDWKNVCLGIVWACGETGLQIPFDQAAQVVGEKCTAGALQQALLKLRGKQIAEGHQIPNLKMAWTRKGKYNLPSPDARSSQEPEANRHRKKPTRMEATQSLIITLPRAYKEQDRQGMVNPYKWKKLSRKERSATLQSPADVSQEGQADCSTSFPNLNNSITPLHDNVATSSYQPEMIQISQPSLLAGLLETHCRGHVTRGSGTLTPNPAGGFQGDSVVYDYVNTTDYSSPTWFRDNPQTPAASHEYLPATPMTGHNFYNSPPATPFGHNVGYLQGMVIGGGEFANLLTNEGIHDYGNGFADATDDVFTT